MRAWMLSTLVVVLNGCDGSDLRTLTRDDVIGIPPGDATGTEFSGEYLGTNNRIEACRCRAGSCSGLVANVGSVALAIQTDGSLQFVDEATSEAAQGGVNADATFHLGYIREDVGNVQYALIEGRFTVSGGTPVSMEMVQDATGRNGGLDCDIRTRATASYLGPLPAAFADSLTRSSQTISLSRRQTGFGLIEAYDDR